MRKFYAFSVAMCMCLFAMAQSTANYAFTTGTNGSLSQDMNGNSITMSTGTSQLVAASSDDVASTVTNIGFDFWFYGSRFTQFSATSNGLVGLGGTVAPATGSSSNLVPYQIAGGTPTSPKLGAFTSDLYVNSTGKVHYKVVGTAPNRCLVVEFLNMALPYNTSAVGGTYQVRLYESTGVVEYVYGAISKNADGGAWTANFSIGFSVGTTVNTNASITTSSQSVSYDATFNTNAYSTGVISDLNSAADGSRRYYRFAPPTPSAAPSAVNFTNVTSTSMTVNWTDNSSDEVAFAIYRSNNGGTTYTFIEQAAANATSINAIALAPSTSYLWRVYAVSEGALTTPATGSQTTSAAAVITSNGTGGGLWSSTSTWIGGVIPTSGDVVTIKNGDVVTIDINGAAYSLNVGEGTSGTLKFEDATARTLTVESGVMINNGASLIASPSGTATTHQLVLNDNITNNGTLNLSDNSGASGVTIVFSGAGNSNFTGSGTTNLHALSLTKASISQIIELNLSSLAVRGLSTSATGALLTSNTGTGTLKISGTNTFSGTLWSAVGYTIPATMGFWLNNPNFTVDGQAGSPTLGGLLRVTQGTLNIGTASNNSMGFSTGSSVIMEGGVVNAAGRFGVGVSSSVISYSQSGGVITVCTAGNTSTTLASFDLGTSTSSVISLTGGTVVVQLASTAASGPRDYRNQAGAGIAGVTGGTLQLGNASSGAAKAFNIAGVIPNFVITNTTANHTATFLAPAVYNNITLDITINTGNTVNFGNQTFLFSGASIVNNGIITHNGASSRFITFKPSTNINYSGTGTVTAPLTSLELQNDLNFTISPSSSNITIGRVILFSGSFVNANKLTLGNGGTTTGIIQIGNTTTPTNGGTFDVPLTFNLGSGGQTISYLRTNIPIVAGGEINPTRVLTNLTIDPDASNKVTLAGGNLQVTGTLTLTTGFFDLSGNTLTLGTSAASRGTLASAVTTLYNGKFKRWFTTATNTGITGDFPVGIATAQRRARVEFTAAPSSGGTLTAEYIAAAPGTNGLPLNDGGTALTAMAQNGFWRISAGDGLAPGTYNLSLVATGYANINNAAELRIVKRVDGSQPWGLEGTHAAGTGVTALRNGLTSFSDFAIASDGAINPLPANLLTFNGSRQGNANLLKWTVAQEKDIVHYEIERSDDNGVRWLSAGVVNSVGATSNQRNYNFTDQNVNGYKQLYRLRQLDINGSVKLSNIIMISVNKVPALSLSAIFPNPAISKLNLMIDAPAKDNIIVNVIDMMGKTVKSQLSNVEAGANTLELNVSDIARGSYLIRISSESGGQTLTSKFIKE